MRVPSWARIRTLKKIVETIEKPNYTIGLNFSRIVEKSAAGLRCVRRFSCVKPKNTYLKTLFFGVLFDYCNDYNVIELFIAPSRASNPYFEPNEFH